MHLHASWDYMHLKALSLHFPLRGMDPILGAHPFVSLDTPLGSMAPSMGMHFLCISRLYASRGYISRLFIPLFSGEYAFGLPSGRDMSQGILFKGDIAPPSGVCIFMHLGTICISRLYLHISLRGYGSRFRGPCCFFLDTPS